MIYLLIEGAEQVSVKKEKQDNGKAETAYACELHGETQFALALFTKRNRQAKTNAAKQSGRSHDDGYDPAQKAQESVVLRIGDCAEKAAMKRLRVGSVWEACASSIQLKTEKSTHGSGCSLCVKIEGVFCGDINRQDLPDREP